MEVHIDKKSGFCFGVANAITMAEEQLKKHGTLFCLGDIVHNNKEIERLSQMGLIVINHHELENLYNTRVLVRAHGEPPQTYQIARKNNITIIEASCPVVLKLQQRISDAHQKMKETGGQVVIFGKEGHAEVVGLMGQTDNSAIVVGNDFNAVDKIDVSKPITLFSQTTQDKEDYIKLKKRIEDKRSESDASEFHSYNTICGQVSNRGPGLAEFATKHQVIVFVSGKKSSNGKYLYNICLKNNPHSYFVSGREDVKKEWFNISNSIGICGATSTPGWLMEEVAEEIKGMFK